MDLGFVGALIALLFLLFGIFAGVGAGDILVKRCVSRKDYIRMNLAVLGVGALLTALVYATGLLMLLMLVFGAMAGTLSGMKMGFGESVGPWKKADSSFGSENSAAAEAGRRARRDGGPEPELMSTVEPGQTKKQ